MSFVLQYDYAINLPSCKVLLVAINAMPFHACNAMNTQQAWSRVMSRKLIYL